MTSTPKLRSSGDLLADRRYAYAEASFRDGDHQAAVDLAAQVLELTPGYAPAYALLGRARTALGDREGGVTAFTWALELDPDDELGVRLDLARLKALAPEEAISPGYVRALFDGYAPRFDEHLVGGLHYRGPQLLFEAVRRATEARRRPFRFRHALDLGCGTGLMARAFAEAATVIEGVDLSPGMLAAAARTGLYARLHEGDLATFLATRPEEEADLVLAADVFVYVAALGPVFLDVRRVLEPNGLFAFTVQAHEGEGVVLGDDARYAHGEGHLRALAAQAGFTVASFERASTRQDRGVAVPGFVVVLAR